MTKFSRERYWVGGALFAIGASAAWCGSAWADDAEKQKLAQCAKDICSIIVSKSASGPDLTCDLTKTWEKDEIQKNADAKKMSWGLGSAKCTAKLSAKRSELISALTSPAGSLKLAKQSVACEIGTEKYSVSATLAPDLKLKDGVATNASLHIDDIKGAALIKGVVWTAATLEQNFGLLEGDIVREVNHFIKDQCPKIVADAK